MVSYEVIKKDKEINALLKKGNENLSFLGFTDHSKTHTVMVANRAASILEKLGYNEHDIELVKIAGFMHDIGNAINRKNHAEYGAILANDILKGYDMDIDDRMKIISAIGHHDESTGGARDALSAALIIADKTDVRRNRVIVKNKNDFDIHDDVNYAVISNQLDIDTQKKIMTLILELDETSCSMFEYFEIFLNRMIMSRTSAKVLGYQFSMVVNDEKVL